MLGAAEVGGAPQPNEDGGANEGVGKDGWNGVDFGNEGKSRLTLSGGTGLTLQGCTGKKFH